MKEKISVIIPMYNVEEYIEECLDSIVNQDYGLENMEVILVDDKSTDNTLSKVAKYVKEYGFILIKNKKNSGQAISRNKAIKIATGSYVSFVDSDDVLYENNLSLLYDELKKNGANMAMARLNAFNSKGEYGYYSDKYMMEYTVTNVYDDYDLINCISVCSKLYDINLIKNIEFLVNTFHEDNSFTLKVLFAAKRIAIVPEYLYHRRIREGENKSTMQKLDYKKFKDLICNYEDVLNNIKPCNDIYFLYKHFVKKLNNYLIKNISIDKHDEARKDIISFIDKSFKGGKIRLKFFNKIYYFLLSFYAKIRK